ncbi:MAG TPA: hypothetical protein VH107_09855, partial [Lacipirellulaceae bacterium]|nr:hypothetical protein [Lacipirellulaceae bacterium]
MDKPFSRAFATILVAPLLLMVVTADTQIASAADQTWSGGGSGTGNAWTSAANWAGGAVPGVVSTTTGPSNTDLATIVATGNNA